MLLAQHPGRAERAGGKTASYSIRPIYGNWLLAQHAGRVGEQEVKIASSIVLYQTKGKVTRILFEMADVKLQQRKAEKIQLKNVLTNLSADNIIYHIILNGK